jgi:hypothetical protein
MHFISRLLPILIVVSGHKFNEWIVRLLLVAPPLVAQKSTMTKSFIRALTNDFGTVGRAAHTSFPNYLAASPPSPVIYLIVVFSSVIPHRHMYRVE